MKYEVSEPNNRGLVTVTVRRPDGTIAGMHVIPPQYLPTLKKFYN